MSTPLAAVASLAGEPTTAPRVLLIMEETTDVVPRSGTQGPVQAHAIKLALELAGFEVSAVTGFEAGWRKAPLEKPAVVVILGSGAELAAAELLYKLGELPAARDVALLAIGRLESRTRLLEAGADAVLGANAGTQELVSTVLVVLHRHVLERAARPDGTGALEGSLAQVSTYDLLSALVASRRNVVVTLASGANQTAQVVLCDGGVTSAAAGALRGADAIFRLLAWTQGWFRVTVEPRPPHAVQSINACDLLAEGQRRLAERQSLLKRLPALSTVPLADLTAVAARDDLPDRAREILELVDGRRSLAELVHQARMADLESLAVVARLWREGLLFPLSTEHGASKPAAIPSTGAWASGAKELARIRLARRSVTRESPVLSGSAALGTGLGTASLDSLGKPAPSAGEPVVPLEDWRRFWYVALAVVLMIVLLAILGIKG